MSCSLSKNLRIVYECSDRPNIRMSIVKVDEKSVKCFDWVFKLLRKRRLDCPRILIYWRSQKLVGWLCKQFLLKLKVELYIDPQQKLSYKNALVGMFHSSTDKDIKDYVIESITSKNDRLRVIICTSALGCGVDCYNIKYLVYPTVLWNIVNKSVVQEEIMKVVVMPFCLNILREVKIYRHLI